MPAILYWLDFVAVPAIILLFSTEALPFTNLSISFLLAGYVMWVFFEYFMHRVLFHHRRSPYARAHHVHHRKPFDADGMPTPGLAVGVLAVVGLLALALLGAHLGASWAVGFMVGYMTYIVTHHLVHNQTITGPIALRHELHHKGWAFNYNLMCPLGDLCFGTYKEVLR